MTDKPSTPVSIDKTGMKSSSAARGRSGARAGKSAGGGKVPKVAKAARPKPNPPQLVRIAIGALLLSAVSGLVASLSLFGLKGWLFETAKKANPKVGVSGHQTIAQLHSGTSTTAKGHLIATLVVVVALVLATRATWAGRYWARWAVIGLWLLATLTGSFVGFSWIISIAQSQPLAFKIPVVLAAASFVVAVVLTNLRPSVAYFNLTRPARPDRPARRSGGLFSIGDQVREAESLPGSSPIRGRSRAARIAAVRAAAAARAESSRGDAVRAGAGSSNGAGGGRAKQRAGAEATARGADLARVRAKASKSRRTGA